MESKNESLALKVKIGPEINMQEYHDNLVLYKGSIEAQIQFLEKRFDICNHPKELVEKVNDRMYVCKGCNKLIDVIES